METTYILYCGVLVTLAEYKEMLPKETKQKSPKHDLKRLKQI